VGFLHELRVECVGLRDSMTHWQPIALLAFYLVHTCINVGRGTFLAFLLQ
jgi:hypothetical protein